MPIARHSHQERHFDILPLTQAPPFASLVNNPNDAIPGSAGGNPIHDLADGVDPQDAATVAQIGAGGGNLDLITGDSATFEATYGAWVGGGPGSPVLTWETGTGWPDTSLSGTAQFVADTVNDAVRIDLTASFVVDDLYGAFLMLNFPDALDDGIWSLRLGNGGDTAAYDVSPTPQNNGSRFALYVVRWRPTGPYATASLYLDCTDLGTNTTATVRIGRAGAALVRPQDRLAYDLIARPVSDATASAQERGLVVTTVGATTTDVRLSTGMEDDGLVLGLAASLMAANGVELQRPDGTAGIDVAFGGGGGVIHYYWNANATAADLSGEGHLFDVGPDYVGLIASEKDATTMQLHPGATGNDIELADDGGVWIIDGGSL